MSSGEPLLAAGAGERFFPAKAGSLGWLEGRVSHRSFREEGVLRFVEGVLRPLLTALLEPCSAGPVHRRREDSCFHEEGREASREEEGLRFSNLHLSSCSLLKRLFFGLTYLSDN